MSVPGEGMWKKAQQEMNPSFHPDLKKTAPERAEVVIGEKGPSGLEDLLAELEENPTDPDLQRQVTLAEELVRRMKEIVKDQGNH